MVLLLHASSNLFHNNYFAVTYIWWIFFKTQDLPGSSGIMQVSKDPMSSKEWDIDTSVSCLFIYYYLFLRQWVVKRDWSMLHHSKVAITFDFSIMPEPSIRSWVLSGKLLITFYTTNLFLPNIWSCLFHPWNILSKFWKEKEDKSEDAILWMYPCPQIAGKVKPRLEMLLT